MPGKFHLMGNNHHGEPFPCQGAYDGKHLTRHGRIPGGCWLVRNTSVIPVNSTCTRASCFTRSCTPGPLKWKTDPLPLIQPVNQPIEYQWHSHTDIIIV